jgi:hypothetical protein
MHVLYDSATWMATPPYRFFVGVRALLLLNGHVCMCPQPSESVASEVVLWHTYASVDEIDLLSAPYVVWAYVAYILLNGVCLHAGFLHHVRTYILLYRYTPYTWKIEKIGVPYKLPFLSLRAGLDQFFFLQNGTVALFVVIWQILSNYGLIRLKRFVSSISSKLYN